MTPSVPPRSDELSPQAEELLRRLRAGELVPAPTAEIVPGLVPTGEELDHSADGPVGRPDVDATGHRTERRTAVDAVRERLVDHLPPGVRGAALDPGLRGALGLGLIALLAALVAVGLAWRSAPEPVTASAVPVPSAVPLPGPPVSGSGPSQPGSTSPGPAAGVAPGPVVEVAGKVRRPGVVTVAAGGRVADALRLAGGPLPGTDTTALSLARKVVDGEQILVTGEPGPAPPPSGGAAGTASAGAALDGSAGAPSPEGAGSGAPAGQLDLNAATVDQLDQLPGVGPVLAGRILEYRTAHNGFASVDQLTEIKGLGGKTGAELKALVRVGP